MRISDWSSDVCSSDLRARVDQAVVQTESAVLPELDEPRGQAEARPVRRPRHLADGVLGGEQRHPLLQLEAALQRPRLLAGPGADLALARPAVEVGVGFLGAHRRHRALDAYLRSEEHTSELQSLMRISYDVFCLKKKNKE